MPGKTPVELHIISDATGETATRLVAALEAQFPDQPFEEVRHPRVESVDDADFVLIDARSTREAVAFAPAGRLVVRAGHLVQP